MPRQAMSTSAAFIAYVSVGSYRRFGSVLRVPGATSCAGNSSSAFASGPEHGVSWSTTSVAPALVDQYFFRMRFTTAALFLASVQFYSGTRFVYSTAPSDRPFSTVGTPPGPPTLPAPVRGSGAGGGGWGQQGRPNPLEVFPLIFPSSFFLVVRCVSSHGRKTDPGVLLPFFGAISVDEHLRR